MYTWYMGHIIYNQECDFLIGCEFENYTSNYLKMHMFKNNFFSSKEHVNNITLFNYKI